MGWEELLKVLERRRWAGTVVYSMALGLVGTFAIFVRRWFTCKRKLDRTKFVGEEAMSGIFRCKDVHE